MTGKSRRILVFAFTTLLLSSALFAQAAAPAREITLQLDPAPSIAEITLPTTLHTVEGKFRCKRGSIHFDPASGKAGGEIVFDATSGNTENGSRDHKMHKEVLESQRYPEIIFRPDHADGAFSASGASTLQVHGQFNIHGADHEVTVPVEITFSSDHWTADAKFPVPYQQWGMKNPSVLFLHVSDTVQVHLHATGNVAH